MGSKMFSLSWADVKPLLIGAGLAAGTAIVTYLTGAAQHIDISTPTGLLLSGLAYSVLDFVSHWLADNSK